MNGGNVGSRPTIVLLEDDALLSDLMTDGLRDAGYSVVPTSRAEAAAGAVDSLGGKAILVADRSVGPASPLTSPSPNGFDTAGAALDRHPGLKVIYVSGTHVAVKRRHLSSRERGLLKPFALSQLVGLVRQLS